MDNRSKKSIRTQIPPKFDIFGVNVSATDYDTAESYVIRAAKQKKAICVSHLAVHGLISAARDQSFKQIINEFDVVAPDGGPVKLSLNLLHDAELEDRVYGPEFMLRVCRRAADEGIGVFLYGSHKHVVNALKDNLQDQFPSLNIAGYQPSLFRPLTHEEDERLISQINESGAGVVFVGLGCPLQERFAHDHKKRIEAVQICVGAAFDFHSGNKKMAPGWMQENSLEWMFRLMQEPSRLWKRYFVTNSIFMMNLAAHIFKVRGLRVYDQFLSATRRLR